MIRHWEFRHRRLLAGVLLAAAAAILLAGFFVSPLLLLAIDRWIGVDWRRLGDISQTYDAASALLAGAAVMGVAASLVIQVRQARIAQVQAARMMHLELMRMLTGDPTLRSTSVFAVGLTEEVWRRNIYTNLFFKYLEMGYEIGHISEESLRLTFARQFRLAHAREFWRRTRELFQVDAGRRATRRFFEIVEEEYARALPQADAEPPRAASERSHDLSGPRRSAITAAATGIVVGTAIVRWIVCRGHRRRT